MLWAVSRALRPQLRRTSAVTTKYARSGAVTPWRGFHCAPGQSGDIVALRKQLKDAAKADRQVKDRRDVLKPVQNSYPDWELTVGIEIHAQLNTAFKLFSSASTDRVDEPNSAVWPFDFALPGSQPLFQSSVLIPAIRAALALNCEVQPRSTFDRKHYFYHDQPSGYQITQYYEPFARNGSVLLDKQDGLPASDGEQLLVGIKQIQLEQDTARTQEQDTETSLIDFNRSGHALIEIISLPHIHSPEAAAAYVRKVQSDLYAIDAVTTGMEFGGLRADVNVSVRRRNSQPGESSFHGVTGLGQRTEIKNLSSFKAVEDAVRAEMVRQISRLEAGHAIVGETRGWSLTSPYETRFLRRKEGEVDYRYMPDPDIAPLYIASDLVEALRYSLPPQPQELLNMLQVTYQLSAEDSKAMLSLDNGARLIYFQDVVDRLRSHDPSSMSYVLASNWVLHELGALLATSETTWTPDVVSAHHMADLIDLLARGKVTGPSAKKLLKIIFNGEHREHASTRDIAEAEGMLFEPLADAEYRDLADKVIDAHPEEAASIRSGDRKAQGKLKFLLGQMMRQGERHRMEALRAEKVLAERLAKQS